MSDTFESTSEAGNARRRSAPRRRPLVIDGTARRVNEGLNPPARIAEDRRVPTSATASDAAGARSYFGRRAASAKPDLLNAASAKRAASPAGHAPEPETSSSGLSPVKIAMIAGAFVAGLFILPSLIAISATPNAAVLPKGAATIAVSPLAIEAVEAVFTKRGGETVLEVSGRISNRSADSTMVPPLELALTDDEGGRVLRSLTVGRDALAGGDSVGFASAVLVPDQAGRALEIGFSRNAAAPQPAVPK